MADLPDRKACKAALVAAGFTNRQVKALLRDSWRGLVAESEAELEELRDQVLELSCNFYRDQT